MIQKRTKLCRLLLLVALTSLLSWTVTVSTTSAESTLGGVCIWTGFGTTSDSGFGSEPIFETSLLISSDTFCGCTWGEVMHQGEPVENAIVTLDFQKTDPLSDTIATSRTSNTTYQGQATSSFAVPVYSLNGYEYDGSGAKRGDVMTLTATYAGETVSRTFRALPFEKNQSIMLPIEDTLKVDTVIEPTLWSSENVDGYTDSLALADDTLWLGGTDGLIARDLTTGDETPYLINDTIQIVPTDAGVYALTPAGLHEISNGITLTHGAPSTLINVSFNDARLAPNGSTPKLTVSGEDDSGGFVAQWDGGWQVITQTSRPMSALLYDPLDQLWVVSKDEGVYRHNADDTWKLFTTDDNVASLSINEIATDGTHIYVATTAIKTGSNSWGGVGVFDLATDTWEVYTSDDGLPASSIGAPADTLTSIAASPYGDVFAGSRGMISWLDGETWQNVPLAGARITSIVAGDDDVFALNNEQLYRFDPSQIEPTAVIITATADTSIQVGGTSVYASELITSEVVGWEWMIGDEVLCTDATCDVIYPDIQLDEGDHTLSFRILDQYGSWSEAVTQSITIPQLPAPPTATIVTATTSPNIYVEGESNSSVAIADWEWIFNDADLCEEERCTTYYNSNEFIEFNEGSYQLSLRVRDEYWQWSEPVTETIIIPPLSVSVHDVGTTAAVPIVMILGAAIGLLTGLLAYNNRLFVQYKQHGR